MVAEDVMPCQGFETIVHGPYPLSLLLPGVRDDEFYPDIPEFFARQ